MEKRTFFLALLAAVLTRTLVAAEPPLRSVGFLVLPGVYNSELMAPYDVLDHVRFRRPDFPKVFTVAKEAACPHVRGPHPGKTTSWRALEDR